MCVCEKEKYRERCILRYTHGGRDEGKEERKERERVCVCVCEREREKYREREMCILRDTRW